MYCSTLLINQPEIPEGMLQQLRFVKGALHLHQRADTTVSFSLDYTHSQSLDGGKIQQCQTPFT